jgi:hypothetical protein
MRYRIVGGLTAFGLASTCSLLLAPGAAANSYQGIPQLEADAVTPTQTRTVNIDDAAEAWFLTSPVDLCNTPLDGCKPGAPALISPFPPDTLHVGVLLGQELFRTYIQPDLSKLPEGANLVGGTMTLPLAAGSSDGTLLAKNAAIRACLTTQRIPDGVQGSTAAPPSIDCATSSPLNYNPTRGGRFRLDLTPFLSAWSAGRPEFGIALVPDAGLQLTDVWLAAFSARKRGGVETISSAITVTAEGVTPSPTPTPTPSGSPSVISPAPEPVVPSLPSQVGEPEAVPPPVVAEPSARQARAAYIGYQYPAGFLIPLALLGLAMFLVRLFTRDLTPRRR